MDVFVFLKESVPKRDKLKQLIVSHTGLSPPAFIAAVAAGAATIAAITCYFKSTPCAATDRETEIEANGTKDTSSEESKTSNCECKGTKEAVKSESNGEASILDEEVQVQNVVADIMASEYLRDDADEMATPVETPKDV